MRKILALFLIFMIGASALFSCQDSGEKAPEGLQIAKISSEGGYKFYAPEGWSVVSTDDIAAAKVSPINNTSITFVEAAVPVGSIPEYFEESLAEFPDSIKNTMTITLRDERCSFGNANGEAYKYIYTYRYDEHEFACMQILLSHDDRFFIFTYTSYGDVNDALSQYSMYLEKVQLSIDAFTFTERAASEAPTYEKDADGYNLVSVRELSGFDLYLPEDYDVVYSSGYVKAKISGGASLSLSKAMQTGVGIADYLKIRRGDMQNFVSDFCDVRIAFSSEFNNDGEAFKDWPFDVAAENDKTIVLGDATGGRAVWEYTYTFNGRAYHVYQVMGVTERSGYVFTYTALEEEYSVHIEEIKTILTKVKF